MKYLCLFAFCCCILLAPTSASYAAELLWPVTDATPWENISSFFGPRISHHTYDFHRGLDIDGSIGDVVRASATGIVYRIEQDGDPASHFPNSGTLVVLKHTLSTPVRFHETDYTTIYTLYAHLDTIADGLEEGDNVSTGDTIGTLGQTGSATHPHLHFEVRIGQLCSQQSSCNIGAMDPHTNPLRFLDYPQTDTVSQFSVTRTHRGIRVTVAQPHHEYDLDRITVTTLTQRKKVLTKKTLSIDSRTGIDASTQSALDTPLFENINIMPPLIDQSDTTHSMTVGFQKILSKRVKRIRVKVYDTHGTLVRAFHVAKKDLAR